MRILSSCILAFTLAACGASVSNSPPAASTYNHDEAKQLIEAQSNCFKREALSKSLANVDIDTAALAVQGRCAVETQRFKAFSARNTIENIPAFEARWRQNEADDLQFIKQLLAVIRTSR